MVDLYDGRIGPSRGFLEQYRRIDTARAAAAVPTLLPEIDHGRREQRADLLGGEIGTTGENECRDACDMRRRE